MELSQNNVVNVSMIYYLHIFPLDPVPILLEDLGGLLGRSTTIHIDRIELTKDGKRAEFFDGFV